MLDTRAEGPVSILRMAHGKASAFDLPFLRALRAEIGRLAAADGVRALVLTGTDRIFSAGMDLRLLLSGGREYIAQVLPALEECVLELLAFPKPAIAAINGHAIAGGCVLACACDARLLAAGDGAAPRLGVPELKVGVPFPAAVLETVRAALPAPSFQALVLRGHVCSPQDALAGGLVDELLPPEQLLPRALALAGELAAMPASSYAETKRLVRAPALERARAASAARRAWLIDAWCSDEVQSAVRRYVEATLKTH